MDETDSVTNYPEYYAAAVDSLKTGDIVQR
jgi:hypothetical protein